MPDGGMPYVQICGYIKSWDIYDTGRRSKRYVAHFSDGTGFVDLVWFKAGEYAYKNLNLHTEYIVFGKPAIFNGRYQFSHPDIDDAKTLVISEMGLQPHYMTTERMKNSGLTSRGMERLTKTLVSKMPPLPETLPDFIVKPNHMVSRDDALRWIHYPHNNDEMQKAQMRLKFEELFYLQLSLLKQKFQRTKNSVGIRMPKVGEAFNLCYNALPFPLTGAQKRVITQIRDDLKSGHQMNRLLQGDVGSGKTVIAQLALIMAAEAGDQGCLMAPTEVLARQHYDNFVKDFEKFYEVSGIRIRCGLLTGSMKQREKKQMYEAIENHEIDILIGTHAVIQEKVHFARLGMVITDEQHRFGVHQREWLLDKGDCPHVLVMSATPIPRTLAIILYGDLDISVIDELPAKRKPIKNCVVDPDYRPAAYRFIEKQVMMGHQVYVICPMVEESEFMDLENVLDYTEKIKKVLPSSISVDYLHGKMSANEKEEVMERFHRRDIQVLVSTTVIEVGINVPNATVMMVENAERFGLAQLHQLRGRVGRGDAQSYCIFVQSGKNSTAKERLEILVKSNDGFFIAGEDLKLRGPGDMFGFRQSGLMDFQIGDLYEDSDLLKLAGDCAKKYEKNIPENLMRRMNRYMKMASKDVIL